MRPSRRSRRTRNEPPEIVPPKSDEEDEREDETEDEEEARAGKRKRRSKRPRKPTARSRGSTTRTKTTKNTDSSGDDDSSDGDQQSESSRKSSQDSGDDDTVEERPETMGSKWKTTPKRGRPRKNQDDDKETVKRKSTRRAATRKNRRKTEHQSDKSDSDEEENANESKAAAKQNIQTSKRLEQGKDRGTSDEGEGSDEDSVDIDTKGSKDKETANEDDGSADEKISETESSRTSRRSGRRRRKPQKFTNDPASDQGGNSTGAKPAENLSEQEEGAIQVAKRKLSNIESAGEDELDGDSQPTKRTRKSHEGGKDDRDISDSQQIQAGLEAKDNSSDRGSSEDNNGPQNMEVDARKDTGSDKSSSDEAIHQPLHTAVDEEVKNEEQHLGDSLQKDVNEYNTDGKDTGYKQDPSPAQQIEDEKCENVDVGDDHSRNTPSDSQRVEIDEGITDSANIDSKEKQALLSESRESKEGEDGKLIAFDVGITSKEVFSASQGVGKDRQDTNREDEESQIHQEAPASTESLAGDVGVSSQTKDVGSQSSNEAVKSAELTSSQKVEPLPPAGEVQSQKEGVASEDTEAKGTNCKESNVGGITDVTNVDEGSTEKDKPKQDEMISSNGNEEGQKGMQVITTSSSKEKERIHEVDLPNDKQLTNSEGLKADLLKSIQTDPKGPQILDDPKKGLEKNDETKAKVLAKEIEGGANASGGEKDSLLSCVNENIPSAKEAKAVMEISKEVKNIQDGVMVDRVKIGGDEDVEMIDTIGKGEEKVGETPHPHQVDSDDDIEQFHDAHMELPLEPLKDMLPPSTQADMPKKEATKESDDMEGTSHGVVNEECITGELKSTFLSENLTDKAEAEINVLGAEKTVVVNTTDRDQATTIADAEHSTVGFEHGDAGSAEALALNQESRSPDFTALEDKEIPRLKRIPCNVETAYNMGMRSSPTHAYDLNKLNRIKSLLYSTGSRVHRGRGFERLFAQYWDAVSLRLSGRLSSQKSERCDYALHAFLKSPRLRKLHNRFVTSIMKQATRRFVRFEEISMHIPGKWNERVTKLVKTQASKRVVDIASLSTPPNQMQIADAPFSARPIYKKIWGEESDEVQPFPSTERTPAEDAVPRSMEKSSSWIPGALAVDPLVRDLAQEAGMRPTENAVWLLVVAMKEHAKNVLKHAISQKEAVENQQVPSRTLHYPKILTTSSKSTSKRDLSQEKQDKSRNMPSTLQQVKTRKSLTAHDIYAGSVMMPTGSIGSLGGSVSRSALERCFHLAHDSLPALPGNDFVKVQRYITGEISSLARSRKVPSSMFAREPDHSIRTKRIQNAVSQPPRGFTVKAERAPQETKRHPSVPIPQNLQGIVPPVPKHTPVPLAQDTGAPVTNEESKLDKPAIRGLGRGAKNLADLMKRSAPSPSPAPSNGEKEAPLVGSGNFDQEMKLPTKESFGVGNPPHLNESNTGSGGAKGNLQASEMKVEEKPDLAPQTQAMKDIESKDSEQSTQGQVIVPVRRGKGFGVKDLAAMRARSQQKTLETVNVGDKSDEANDKKDESSQLLGDVKAAGLEPTEKNGTSDVK